MSEVGVVRLSKRLVPPLSGLDAALETIRGSASSQRELGGRFERLMCRVLLEHPGARSRPWSPLPSWDPAGRTISSVLGSTCDGGTGGRPVPGDAAVLGVGADRV